MFAKLFKLDNMSYYRKLANIDLQNFDTFKADYKEVKTRLKDVSLDIKKIIDIEQPKNN